MRRVLRAFFGRKKDNEARPKSILWKKWAQRGAYWPPWYGGRCTLPGICLPAHPGRCVPSPASLYLPVPLAVIVMHRQRVLHF